MLAFLIWRNDTCMKPRSIMDTGETFYFLKFETRVVHVWLLMFKLSQPYHPLNLHRLHVWMNGSCSIRQARRSTYHPCECVTFRTSWYLCPVCAMDGWTLMAHILRHHYHTKNSYSSRFVINFLHRNWAGCMHIHMCGSENQAVHAKNRESIFFFCYFVRNSLGFYFPL